MTRILRYMMCSATLLMCAPSFSQPTQMMLSLNEAKHYHAKPTGQVYIQADKFQRKSNANYYKLIVQSTVKNPVQVVHQQGYYSVTVGPLASASSIRTVADKLKYDPGLSATKYPAKAASSFVAKHGKKADLTNHKQLAVYDRSTLTNPTTEEPTTATEPATTPESETHTEAASQSDQTTNTEKDTSTDQSPSSDHTTTDSTMNTEPPAQPEQPTEQNQTPQNTETQQDTPAQQSEAPAASSETTTEQPAQDDQSKQTEQATTDDQPKEAEKATSNESTKVRKHEKHVKQIKSKAIAKSAVKPEAATTLAAKSEPVASKPSRLQSLINIYPKGNWIVSAGVGASYPSFGSSMTIGNNSGAPAPYNMDVYTTKSRTQPITALSVGYRWVRDQQWLPAFSLNASYQHLFSRNVGSQVIQYSDPEFTNYNYDWEVSSDILMALLKANIFEYHGVSPYVLGGVGAAFNRASNYSEGALSGVTARTNPAFGVNTMTNYAYRIGAGLEYQIDPQVLISMEYQFQSIGNITSDYGTQAWSGQYLNLGSYQSNAFLLTVTYLFGATN